jgi:hypothetical protein
MKTSHKTSGDISHTIGARWRDIPLQTIQRTAQILGCAPSSIYSLLKTGKLSAVSLGGKTLIPTKSINALIRTAKPWTPDHARVAKAMEARRKSPNKKQLSTKSGVAL